MTRKTIVNTIGLLLFVLVPAIAFCIDSLRTLMLQGTWFTAFYLLVRAPKTFAECLLVALANAACVAMYYLRSERNLRFLYGVLYALYAFFLLPWIFPWALITVRDERWGTR